MPNEDRLDEEPSAGGVAAPSLKLSQVQQAIIEPSVEADCVLLLLLLLLLQMPVNGPLPHPGWGDQGDQLLCVEVEVEVERCDQDSLSALRSRPAAMT